MSDYDETTNATTDGASTDVAEAARLLGAGEDDTAGDTAQRAAESPAFAEEVALNNVPDLGDLPEPARPADDGDSAEATDAGEAAEPTVDPDAADGGGDGEAEEEDPIEALRTKLRTQFGDWYVVHSYAGYENKVKTNLESRIQSLDMEDYIFEVLVPTEDVFEVKNNKRQQVSRKVFPGYILVRMDLNDESWGAVRNTPESPASSVPPTGRRR